jgi:ABC-type nitrate/sulfonate/bicarbonate transport system substrate-binding protein
MNKISALHPPSSSFSYSRSPAPTPLGLAVHLGWLSGDRASEATAIRTLKQGRLLSDEERHGEYALANAFRQGSIMPPAWARARGADTRVIGLSWTDESQLILTLPRSGIGSTRDLRGRRFALPVCNGEQIDHFRASALRTLLTALALDGLAYDDVEIVPVEANPRKVFDAEVNALLRNEVDAIYVRGLAGVRLARTLALRTVIDLRRHPDPVIRNNGCTLRAFTANAAVLKQFPDVSNCFLQLVVDAAEWARVNPVGAFAYAATEAGVEEALVREAYGDELPANLDLNLHPQSVEALKDFTVFLTDWGFIEREVDVESWIDYAPLAGITSRDRRSA